MYLCCPSSFPAMGTWIEITAVCVILSKSSAVVPCNGNVDWNTLIPVSSVPDTVVPCNGNVDWNIQFGMYPSSVHVVPCNGNVDWNANSKYPFIASTRRSLQWERGLKLVFRVLKVSQWSRSLQWERGLKCNAVFKAISRGGVVPCNGNVDWNSVAKTAVSIATVVPCNGNVDWNNISLSLSDTLFVVPCNGNVDWNMPPRLIFGTFFSRSLQWERGLKYCWWWGDRRKRAVVPCNGNVDWNLYRI